MAEIAIYHQSVGPILMHFYKLWDNRYNIHTVKQLISEVNLNQKGMRGKTPLMLTLGRLIPKGKLEPEVTDMVKLFLDNGADCNISDDSGVTPLMIAAEYDYDLSELLVESGAYVNARDADGRTPLMLAAWAGQEKTMRLLIKKGANIDTVDIENNSARDLCNRNVDFNLTVEETLYMRMVKRALE